MNIEVWKDCVIKDDKGIISDQINEKDTIYRIKTENIDIRGTMTVACASDGSMIAEFRNYTGYLETICIDITPEMRIFKTDSPDDPGILVQRQNLKFNPNLRVGKLYWIANADLKFQYVMHIRAITGNSVDVNIINTITDLNNTSSIKIIGKSFDITELLEYKFKEV